MNHVPNEALAALDGLGYGLLVGQPKTIQERLRRDFRLRIPCDQVALDDGTTRIEFRLQHGAALAQLREHGSYVCTIVNNVESRLQAWGLEPPPAYGHHATEEGWQVYAGRLAL